jgi:Spy/CpxP family protein refolding chaperone
MSRIRVALLLPILAAVSVLSASAAQPAAKPNPASPWGGGMGPFGPPGAAPAFSLPGYWTLGMENTQKELQITDEQKQKLKELADKYQADMREYWSRTRELPREEQRKRFAEWRENSAKQQQEIRKQVESVLRPEQVARLKERNLRVRGPALLGSPRTMEKLTLSGDQKEKLQKVREESQQKMQQLQQQMQKLQQATFDKSYQLLTPEQQAKLKEQVETQPW